MTKPLPGHRLHRTGDPATSLEAARLATKASRRAMEVVKQVMDDGVGRTDQELHRDVRATGYLKSLNTVQHGRLALSEAGVLVWTGATRVTVDNMPAREWILATSPLAPAPLSSVELFGRDVRFFVERLHAFLRRHLVRA